MQQNPSTFGRAAGDRTCLAHHRPHKLPNSDNGSLRSTTFQNSLISRKFFLDPTKSQRYSCLIPESNIFEQTVLPLFLSSLLFPCLLFQPITYTVLSTTTAVGARWGIYTLYERRKNQEASQQSPLSLTEVCLNVIPLFFLLSISLISLYWFFFLLLFVSE